jgi:hypothetical protein
LLTRYGGVGRVRAALAARGASLGEATA